MQEIRPFDNLLFTASLVEKLSEKNILSDEEIMGIFDDQRRLAEQAHYDA
ncbi:MAG TPA: hypothetical protein VKB39_08375 [Candidatus Baltobacteraceae bacterium]|nr:hypothetical protein [Candidatus Baltobacteraceae bacterium]